MTTPNKLNETVSHLAERLAGVAASLHSFDERIRTLSQSLGRISALLLIQAGLPVGNAGMLFGAASFLMGKNGNKTSAHLRGIADGSIPVSSSVAWAIEKTAEKKDAQSEMQQGVSMIAGIFQNELKGIKGIGKELKDALLADLTDQLGHQMSEGRGHKYHPPGKTEQGFADEQLAEVTSGKKKLVIVDTEYAPTFDKQTGEKIGKDFIPVSVGFSNPDGTGGQSFNIPLIAKMTAAQKDVIKNITGEDVDGPKFQGDPKEAINKMFTALFASVGESFDPSRIDELMEKVLLGGFGLKGGTENDVTTFNQLYNKAYPDLPTSPFQHRHFMEGAHLSKIQPLLQELSAKNLPGSLQNLFEQNVEGSTQKLIDSSKTHGTGGPRTAHQNHHPAIDSEMWGSVLTAAPDLPPPEVTPQEKRTKPAGGVGSEVETIPLKPNLAALADAIDGKKPLSQRAPLNVPVPEDTPPVGVSGDGVLDVLTNAHLLSQEVERQEKEEQKKFNAAPSLLVATDAEILKESLDKTPGTVDVELLSSPGLRGPEGETKPGLRIVGNAIKNLKSRKMDEDTRAVLGFNDKRTVGSILQNTGMEAIPHLRAFGQALAAATGLLGKFANAGAPDAFATLQGVMEIISAQIGSMFVPAIVKATSALMDFANELEKHRSGPAGKLGGMWFDTQFGNPARGAQALGSGNFFSDKLKSYTGISISPKWFGGGFNGAGTSPDDSLRIDPKMITAAKALVSVKTTPQYSGLEDTYKKVQLDILGKGPVEKILEQIHEQTLIKMLKELEKANAERDRREGNRGTA